MNPQRADFSERNFKYLLIGPAIFVLLLIGIFPLVYLLLVSFQGITMTNVSTDFIGGGNYVKLFNDVRLWEALLHTVVFTAIALPIELLLGLVMAQLFLDKIPAGSCSSRCWYCRSWSHPLFPEPPGRCCSIIASDRSIR